MNDIVLSLEKVHLKFKLHKQRSKSLKDTFSTFLSRKKIKNSKEQFHALNNINFNLKKGERLGIVGANGSGKSSLLKIICKIYEPSSGSVKSNLKITPLLEAGAGFQPEFTGRENIYLNGAINGMSRNEIEENINEIISFSEVGDFIDIPVKNYSTGMYMKLAFSISTALNPELLIIDELFVGGDFKFLKKGKDRIHKLINKSKSMILVSHDHETLRTLCNKFIWIENGIIKKIGNEEVLDFYLLS
tara:strand:+ start:815 stop:1552 length:738 start_codon:yes stop_codon:yes gene_type:complete